MKKGVKDETWVDHEIFTSKGRKIKHPWITITDNSSFLFNAAFVHLSNLSKNTHVVLGFSRKKKAITFQFTSDPQALGALTFVLQAGRASIQLRSFFNYHLLNVSDWVGRYIPEKVRIPKTGEVWAINLESKLPEK